MKSVKFYYSAETHIRRIPVLTDAQGNVTYIFDRITSVVKKIPRITVASVYDPIENKMTFGCSVCSPKDVFNKKFGRELAEERARKYPEITIVSIHRNKIRETSKKYANMLISKHLEEYV